MANLFSWFFDNSTNCGSSIDESQEIRMFIQDEEHTVQVGDFPPDTTLNDYLRETIFMTGTKNMCFEAGCGACVVAITRTDPVTQKENTFSVNSCLVPLYMCSDWKIHTIEELAKNDLGHHPLQKAMVKFNGTQCGFCTSGMIMNMYPLYESGNFTMRDVENAFGGNICRCTGYRAILSAFKSLASDADPSLLGTVEDIEELTVCQRSKDACQSKCTRPCNSMKAYCYTVGKSRWMKVFSINEIIDVLTEYKDDSYMLVGGNTATGVYPRTTPIDIFIDITSVKNLHDHWMDGNHLVLGANMTLTKTIELFQNIGKENELFAYLIILAEHIDLIANTPVRNSGTLAGNLTIKHNHHEFPSDIFLIFETVGATLTIEGTERQSVKKNLIDFLSFDMTRKLIREITFPPLDKSYKINTYKIMPRAQNAHALVNGGFLIKFDANNKVESARIVYGGINPDFVHASQSEEFLKQKNLFTNETLKGLWETLDKELHPDHVLPDSDPKFRKGLAISLCYKVYLRRTANIAPDNIVSPQNKSGGQKLTRDISYGSQDYETNKSLYPLTEPITKLEAMSQCTGQAKYIVDETKKPYQLYACFVTAKAPANSVIEKIDTSEALAMEGIVAYYDKNDIVGKNTFTPKEVGFAVEEEIFCSGTVKYYSQPIGIIVGKAAALAEKAAEAVQVTYTKSNQKPKITIRSVVNSDDKNKIDFSMKKPAKSKGNDTKHIISGTFDIYGQYHFHMERQACVAVPDEDGGLDLYPTTQSIDVAQHSAAIMLNIPATKVNVSVRRLGGAFGSKISRNAQISCATSLAAYKLKKPVTMILSLKDNMNVVGKRNPCSSDFKMGVNDDGVIQYMEMTNYSDYGCEGGNEGVASLIVHFMVNLYNVERWDITAYSTRCDVPTQTWCRAPGTNEALALCESIMDQIAYVVDKDPIDVRLANLDNSNKYLLTLVEDMKQWADVEKRQNEIKEFNKKNRWMKRGLSTVIMNYPLQYYGTFGVIVSIFHGDGSVAISHGGIEMGQGINTKVAQVCAYTLQIPLDQISIKGSTALTTPNSAPSGGSVTSESVCYATVKACEILKSRMKVVKDKMHNPTWVELVQKCYTDYVELCATSMFEPSVPDLKDYSIYAVTCAEVEVDLLTGLHVLRRVDIIEDTGRSMNPLIDIGQIEGAFIMGLGYWSTEQLIYNDEGQLLTNRTWNYRPPGAKDIPVDFRIKLPKNGYNPYGVLQSKAVAEPPLCTSCAIPLAIRHALSSARIEANATADKWFAMNGPTTVEETFVNSLNHFSQYTL